MFSDLPKLADRSFVIGFMLPFAVLLAATYSLASAFGYSGPIEQFSKENPLIAVFLVWLGAVFLLAINDRIIRLKEGYGDLNPARLFGLGGA